MSDTQTSLAKPSLRDIFSAIGLAEDLDQAHIIAGAFNLYYTAISKLGGRKHLGSDDIRKLFAICRSLLDASRVEQEMRGRPQRG